MRRTVADGERADCRRVRERGQVAVLFALLLPMILVLGAVVVDVGNWYVHKRHLQTLVDAGAFAGATKFVGCSFQFGDPVAANAAIKAAALRYSGDTIRDPATLNLQVQEPNDVRVVLNSAQYWTDGYPTDGVGLDDTLDPDNDPLTVTAGDPCSSRTLDVKATDDDAPLLFGFIPLVIDIKSKARVEIQQVIEQSGMLPWAVPEVDPAAVVAIFVDENTGDVLATQLLLKKDDASLPFSEWTSSLIDNQVDLASENTGVVILVSKVNDDPFRTTGPAGTLTDICTQPGLVTCYAGDGNQAGLTFIHGWSDTPVAPGDPPQIRDVSLQSIDCDDDLSAPYFLRAGDCDLGLTAVIDFGVTGVPTDAPLTGVSAQVELNAPGCGGGGCNMAYIGPASSPTESIWMTTQNATLGAMFEGRANFSISWEIEYPAGTGNSGTWAGVAHPYVADGASGPIDYLKLGNLDGAPDSNSRNQSPPDRSVIVTVGLNKPFEIKDPLEPPVVLRVASPSGSQNQAINCDKSFNFATEIENGCRTTYRENYGDWDKDGFKEWEDLLCTAYPNPTVLPPDDSYTGPAPNCVRIETGDKLGQFRSGLSSRFETPTCAPNNWPNTVDEIDDFFLTYDLANDPRYVTLIVTDYGTFQGAGSSELVPVKYFAGFYATGWDRGGAAQGCPDNDPHPWYGSNYRQSLDNGDVWGHFINIVLFSSSGSSDDELCNFDGVGTCIAVLVE